MNVKIQFKTIPILIIIISCFMLAPALLALYFDEIRCFRAFSIVIVGSCLVSLAPLYRYRNVKTGIMSIRDGFLFVTLSWVIAACMGALPLYLSGALPSFADCYFEIMSGFSTTGASILTDIEGMPRSILFWRSLTSWLGGMGIVVLTVAILPILGIGGLQLLRAEAPGPTVDKLSPRIAETAKILWFIYIGFTAAQVLLLMLGGMDWFDAFTHPFATLATGGFSTKNASVGHTIRSTSMA
jgi:trk system potassium uptake protein TrkH